jgi:uncharacterized metal-binding protein
VTIEKGTIQCGSCTKFACKKNYPEGIPAWCAATRYQGTLEQTKKEYASGEQLAIYLAAARVLQKGYEKWPRIKEAVEFARELGLKKIGLASCVGLIDELGLVTRLFTAAGFEVVAIACQIGKVSPEERGVAYSTEGNHGLTCNPIAQAEIFNQEKTELNYLLGLCLGHDILFQQKSKAPVSTLIVKDRVTGHNPAAVLYADHLRRGLFKGYEGK